MIWKISPHLYNNKNSCCDEKMRQLGLGCSIYGELCAEGGSTRGDMLF